MKKQILIYVFLSGFVSSAGAQLDSLQLLQEVYLSDTKLHDFAIGVHQQQLPDSVIKQQQTQLTQTLRYHSLIYLRENGPGGVSSASFRGD